MPPATAQRRISFEVVMNEDRVGNLHSRYLLRGATGLTFNHPSLPKSDIIINLSGINKAIQKSDCSIGRELIETVVHEIVHTFEDYSDPAFNVDRWEALAYRFEKRAAETIDEN